ncbi:MAG: amino acid--[acyl-carrier-protein] ligase [Acidimicrobiales bacterium]
MSDAGLFRDELVAAGLLVLTGTDGIYGRSSVYEDIVAAVDGLAVGAALAEGAVSYRFPPVMPRQVFEQTGYLSSFPDLMGSVSTFTGNNADHRKLMDVAQAGGDWTALLQAAGANLCPAACHPLYPTLAGTLPEGGRRFDVAGWCYRHEPSVDPARMQAFRMHELVYVGDAAGATEHRDRWLQLGVDVLASLGLEVQTVVANDPFFGRVGRILADNQRAETLKFEIVTPISSAEHPTAIGSSNCHLDHFGEPFGIETADGGVAHSCCFGFGLDRITLALLRTHGMDPGDWPAAARDRLWA